MLLPVTLIPVMKFTVRNTLVFAEFLLGNVALLPGID
jgi:hypothetical protein